MTNVFENYFRLRNSDLSLEFPVQNGSAPGFFRFGGAGIGFGRVEGVRTRASADEPLEDARASVDSNGGSLRVPFDPSDVVDQLRNERYETAQHGRSGNGALKRIARQLYYGVRPLLPVGVRRHLQRLALADWKTIPFPNWPLDCTVDRLLRETLVHAIRARGGEPIPFIWFWPDGLRACVIVTHDVETDAGQRFCPKLMSMNEEFGFLASFQIVPEERYAKRDTIHAEMRERGHEINLHGLNHDGKLFEERGEFLRRAAKINEYAASWGSLGFRSPVLYRKQDWFGALNFDYDMSVPNTARLEAQRGGCCTVMPYFIGDLVELPTTSVEDYTLLHILRDRTTNIWCKQLDTVTRMNGIFNLLVHPDYQDTETARQMYRSFLFEMRERADVDGLWVPLPREASAWWRARSKMTLVGEGPSARITGDPDRRARVALARLENGRLVFDLPKPESARTHIVA
jgi:hypothetical protein